MILGGGWCECCSAEVGGDWEARRWWWWWVVTGKLDDGGG